VANTDKPNGFKPEGANPKIGKYLLDSSTTISKGDVIIMGSDGYVSRAAEGTGAKVVGVAAMDKATQASAGETLYVYDDPDQIYTAQCETDLVQADYYDSKAGADITGSSGNQEIQNDDNTGGCIRILGLAADLVTGEESVVGSWCRVRCKIDNNVHMWGTET